MDNRIDFPIRIRILTILQFSRLNDCESRRDCVFKSTPLIPYRPARAVVRLWSDQPSWTIAVPGRPWSSAKDLRIENPFKIIHRF